MNERIQELAEQAWCSTREELGSIVNEGGELNWDFLHTYDKSFARLIVEQCIDKIETYKIPRGNSRSGELACEWTYNALREIRDEIKLEFGIE